MIEFSLHLSGQEFREVCCLIGFIALCYFAYKATVNEYKVSYYYDEED